jgi:hypothetical protein
MYITRAIIESRTKTYHICLYRYHKVNKIIFNLENKVISVMVNMDLYGLTKDNFTIITALFDMFEINLSPNMLDSILFMIYHKMQSKEEKIIILSSIIDKILEGERGQQLLYELGRRMKNLKINSKSLVPSFMKFYKAKTSNVIKAEPGDDSKSDVSKVHDHVLLHYISQQNLGKPNCDPQPSCRYHNDCMVHAINMTCQLPIITSKMELKIKSECAIVFKANNHKLDEKLKDIMEYSG